MTARQFWYGDPWLAAAFRRKHDLDREQRNQEAWMQGLYFMDALNVVIGNAFGKKGSQKRKYLENPIRITPLTEREKREQAERDEAQTVAYFTKMQEAWERKQKGGR